jgi:LPS sulfotransferase NodH
MFALPRTGSEYLCAQLRRMGAGVPIEYFHQYSKKLMGTRLNCLKAGALDVPRYIAELEARRTTPNGVFGMKLITRQLPATVGTDPVPRVEFMKRFDRVLFLRRRDRLLQAISFVRALKTNQWHLIPGDRMQAVAMTADQMSSSSARQRRHPRRWHHHVDRSARRGPAEPDSAVNLRSA